MVTTKIKVLFWILGVSSSLTIGAVAGIYSRPTPEVLKRIANLSQEEKESGKIFKAVEHKWDENRWTPYTLFECVNSSHNNVNSCEQIQAFTEMSFQYGNALEEIFKCTGLTSSTKTPLYYFDQNLETNAKPTDLDWSKLTRATAETRKFGKYVVIKISEKDQCDGKVEKSTLTAYSDFWKKHFSINKAWDEKNSYSKDLSVFLKIENTSKQHYWRPIAPLSDDFDVDLVKKELKKYMPKK